jgi:hypothetical protein
MGASATYFGAPRGYATLQRSVATSLGGVAVYRNRDVTIYRVRAY